MKKVYLAVPYTSKRWKFWPVKQLIEFWRFIQVSRVAMRLMNKGLAVFSPISMNGPIGWFQARKKRTHDFWLEQDYNWLEQCDEVWVLTLKGWKESYGISKEIEYAKEWEIPIFVIDLDYSLTRED